MSGYFRALLLILCVLLASTAYADRIGVLISEPDGTPADIYAYKIIMPNGTTSITDGVLTYTDAGASGVNETYGSGWNADTNAPEKDDVYDYLHLLDTDDDGDIDTIDATLWATKQAADATLTDIADGTIAENLVNTANPWEVNEGGTGAATFTDHGILLGSGAAAFTALGEATNGQIPIGSTGADPVLATIAETGDSLVVTNAAGSITLSVAADLENIVDTWAVDASGNVSGIGTISAGAGGFTVGVDGAITAVKSIAVTKASGVAGDFGLYEANSTDTHGVGFRGPASITGDGAYRGQFPNARPASANIVMAWTNAAETGTGTAADPYIQALSWIDLDLYALKGDNLSVFAATTSAQLAGVLSNETGTGAAVFAESPVLVTPTVGVATGTSLTLTGVLTGLAPSVIVTKPSGVATAAHEYILTHADDSSASNVYVGMTLYNVTTADSCTVTASTNTTITCAADSTMGWDDDPAQSYQLGPGPLQSGSIFYVGTAGTIRHPATAGYVAGYYVDVAGAVIVDMASDSMIFKGVLSAAFATLDAGDCIESPATEGSFYMLHNKSATSVVGFGSANTWIDGGTS